MEKGLPYRSLPNPVSPTLKSLGAGKLFQLRPLGGPRWGPVCEALATEGSVTPPGPGHAGWRGGYSRHLEAYTPGSVCHRSLWGGAASYPYSSPSVQSNPPFSAQTARFHRSCLCHPGAPQGGQEAVQEENKGG